MDPGMARDASAPYQTYLNQEDIQMNSFDSVSSSNNHARRRESLGRRNKTNVSLPAKTEFSKPMRNRRYKEYTSDTTISSMDKKIRESKKLKNATIDLAPTTESSHQSV